MTYLAWLVYLAGVCGNISSAAAGCIIVLTLATTISTIFFSVCWVGVHNANQEAIFSWPAMRVLLVVFASLLAVAVLVSVVTPSRKTLLAMAMDYVVHLPAAERDGYASLHNWIVTELKY